MLTAEQIVAMAGRRDRALPAPMVTSRLQTIDQGSNYVAALGRVRWELWDQTSPINGCDAETMKARPDWIGGAAYLIYVDDVVVYFQPHDPSGLANGPMTEEQAAQAGAAQASLVATQMADAETVRQVMTGI